MICPFCKEEIKDGAIKCKHCGSILDGSSSTKSKTDSKKPKKGGVFLGQIILLLACLYIGGWGLLWVEKLHSNDAFVIQDNGFAVKIDDAYYGMKFSERFLNSPAISWILLFLGFGMTPFIIIPLGGSHGD